MKNQFKKGHKRTIFRPQDVERIVKQSRKAGNTNKEARASALSERAKLENWISRIPKDKRKHKRDKTGKFVQHVIFSRLKSGVKPLIIYENNKEYEVAKTVDRKYLIKKT